MLPRMTGPGTTAGTPTYRTSRRPHWQDVSAAARDAVERRLNARVVAGSSAIAGFTPGLASVLTLDDGRAVFLKGAGPTQEAWLAQAYRREAATVAALPSHPATVPLLWTLDADGWFLAAYEAVAATHPPRPWTQKDAARVLDTLVGLGASLTPPPPGIDAPSWVGELGVFVDQLRLLEPRLGPARTAEIRELARRVLLEAPATTLSHDDVRDDNLLLGADGSVRLVDWSAGLLAPPWFMAVVAMIAPAADGVDVRALLAAHPATRDVPAAHVDGVIALHLGYFLGVADLDEVESSPWLRAHQRWYRDATLRWFERV